MRIFFNDCIKKAYEMVCRLVYDNNIYCPIYRYKYTKYNIPSGYDVPYIINIVYEDIFGFKTNGVFVEIGAFDGETASFTCFLADIGWTGHYVEPIKRYFINCLNRHKKNKVSCYNFFIGDFVGKSTMFDYGPFSKKTIVNNFKAIPPYNKETGESVNINCFTMDMFLRNQEIPHEIDLLLIDVEDAEINVLKSFSLLGKEYSPTAIIIETTHENETKDILTSSGYVQYCSLDTDDPFTKNLIFVSRKRANGQFPLLNKMKEMKIIPLLNKMKETQIINFSDIASLNPN
jgi:FkbM family methyltransferase